MENVAEEIIDENQPNNTPDSTRIAYALSNQRLSGGSASSGSNNSEKQQVKLQRTGSGTTTTKQTITIGRRRSWRTHYSRPNKSLDYDTGNPKEVKIF